MKRARVEEGFNPVYPYGLDDKYGSIAPPFVASDGLQEDPPGVLSLKIERPLSFSTNKALTLSVGNGLDINQSGELEVKEKPFTAEPPLNFENGVLALKTDNTLSTISGQLHSNLTATAPLSLNNNLISVAVGNGITVRNEQLQLDLQATSPLSLSNHALSLNHTAPLSNSNNQLTVLFQDPLYVYQNRLAFRLNDLSGLRVVSGGLQVKAGWGIEIARNNDLTLKRLDPIAVYENGSNEGKLYLKKDDNMFTLNNGNLQLRVATNGCLAASGGVYVNSGNGLQRANNVLSVKIGNGLSFDSTNALQVTPTSQFPTMWSTLSPSANTLIKNASGTQTGTNAKLTLSLTKIGPIVTALVKVEATGSPISPISVDRATTLITFDRNGNVTAGITNFGIKNGDGIDNSASVSKLQFMPNNTIYPENDNAGNYVQADGFLDKNRTKPAPLVVVLNGETDPFAIRLIWNLDSYKNGSASLNTSSYSFSYYSQTQS